jgi:GR25 family glycosyltransferase involved in LPS biosynthesis
VSREAELTSLFGHVYVINLPQRTDRHDEIGAQLRRVGLDWDSPDVTCFAAARPADEGGFESIGAHGCYLSHLGVLDSAIAAGHESILILEDDCNFVAAIDARLREVASSLTAHDWSMFYGGGFLHGIEAARPLGAIAQVSPEQPLSQSHCIALRGLALREAPGYLRELMSRPGGHPDGGKMDVDGAYTWFRRRHSKYRAFIATPEFAYQRHSRTDIGADTWKDRLPLVRQLVAAGRKAMNLHRR